MPIGFSELQGLEPAAAWVRVHDGSGDRGQCPWPHWLLESLGESLLVPWCRGSLGSLGSPRRLQQTVWPRALASVTRTVTNPSARH